jgi:hypothetical protein
MPGENLEFLPVSAFPAAVKRMKICPAAELGSNVSEVELERNKPEGDRVSDTETLPD